MKLKIDRRWKKEKYTIGRLYVNGIFLCNTLEDTDRNLNSSMSEDVIRFTKIAGETAIPTGTYKVVLAYSPKFAKKSWGKKYGGLVPLIFNVKGFDGVRLHVGNCPADTLGCPLVGDNKTVGRLTNSTKRYYELMDKYIMPAWTRKEEITITIK